jgi:threonyl-tRNA synthetase
MNNKLETMRHSASHVMSMAVLELFPKAKMGVGPATSDGFYQDYQLSKPLTPKDLKKIEKIMGKIKSQKLKFEHEEWGIRKAINYFKKNEQFYKIEIINDLEKESILKGKKIKKISIYKTGNYIDLCSGPHVKDTSEIGFYKLLSNAGAYWKASEKNQMLTRIYGTAFEDKNDLKQYIHFLEEAKKYDHRILGKRLGVYMFDSEIGAGLPIWLPNGARLLNTIKNYAFNTYLANGYEPVSTPHIASIKLFKHSGHLEFYKENIYNPFELEKDNYILKPMNCPFHVKIYNSSIHSYRDLPIRWTEMGTVYRYEKSGVLHGLTRVRGFTQDDAHIICTAEQLSKELDDSLKLIKKILKEFGFGEFQVNVSVRDMKNKDKFIGTDEDWKQAERSLVDAVKKAGFNNFVYDIGGAVFYGPKIDIKIKDTMGRLWQCSTVQVDFNLPERFDMSYIDPSGNKATPFMVHRAVLGSLERFIGILLEYHKGQLPLWISPIQVKILPISDKHIKYANKIKALLSQEDIVSTVDNRSESTGKKIREAQIEKVPYMLIVGDREVKSNKVSLRNRSGKDFGAIALSTFLKQVKTEIEKKK